MLTFITFGSHSNYLDAANRLLSQAKKANIFDELILYTADHLQTDHSFWSKHQTFFENNKRGYGYWLWKPYLIKRTMEKMKNGDVLLYLDAGCELDPNKKKEILNCVEIVKRDKIVATCNCREKDWNKMDLILKLDLNNDFYLNDYQHQAGAVLFLVCDETRQLVNDWYEIGCDYHFIDDSPSVFANCHTFQEHRHDQSIFSLLTKKYRLFSNHSLYNSISYDRNRTGESKI